MKTTDSVMRDFDKRFALKYPSGNALAANYDEMKDFIRHSLAEARREWVEETIDIVNKMETWHYTNASPLIFREDLKRLLTGDNPENECKVCHRTSDVVDMSKCPFCEHDQELIREGRAMSDFDTRRGE